MCKDFIHCYLEWKVFLVEMKNETFRYFNLKRGKSFTNNNTMHELSLWKLKIDIQYYTNERMKIISRFKKEPFQILRYRNGNSLLMCVLQPSLPITIILKHQMKETKSLNNKTWNPISEKQSLMNVQTKTGW